MIEPKIGEGGYCGIITTSQELVAETFRRERDEAAVIAREYRRAIDAADARNKKLERERDEARSEARSLAKFERVVNPIAADARCERVALLEGGK